MTTNLSECPQISEVLNRIGDKWTVLVIMSLRESPKRFNELKRSISGVSQQMLTRTLKLLERDGLLARRVIPTVPLQVEYRLTELGVSLSEPLLHLGSWAAGNLQTIHSNRLNYDTAAQR